MSQPIGDPLIIENLIKYGNMRYYASIIWGDKPGF